MVVGVLVAVVDELSGGQIIQYDYPLNHETFKL